MLRAIMLRPRLQQRPPGLLSCGDVAHWRHARFH